MLKQLENDFAAQDAEFADNQAEWAEGRITALREIKTNEAFLKVSEITDADRSAAECDRFTRASSFADERKRDFKYSLCGGKTWYEIFANYSRDGAQERVAKNCASIAKNRNARIIKRMEKEGITKLSNARIEQTTDGFNGYYAVTTDKGEKILTLTTIIAGGYNIQCAHLRTLISIK